MKEKKEEPKKKKIDWRKAIIFSEILKPKFENHKND